jgi:uroporphyrinogen III methyltransferase / synthase
MKVTFIGAGPGDPELLTVKGRAALEQCEAVVFDATLPAALLDLAPASAERVPATSKAANALIELAKRGLRVARLIKGDPLLFSPAPSEAVAVYDAGVDFEFIPGVPAEFAAASTAGLPLTAGRLGTLVIGRAKRGSETLVQTSGDDVGVIAIRPNMVLLRNLGLPGQEETGIQNDAADGFQGEGAALFVHYAAHQREKLNWRSRLALNGRRVCVTRAREQANSLSAGLRALGAETIELPAIEIHPADDFGPLDAAIARLSSYDWLIFTSANGVRFFMERLDHSQTDLRALRARICAIGPATRAAVEAAHLKVDLMGAEWVAESLLAAFAAHEIHGSRVLLPRARVARDLVPTELARRGAQVDVVEAYCATPPADAAARAREIFSGPRKPHFITFTSSSTVKNFVAAAPPGALEGVQAVSIGPITTATARELGVEIAGEASEFTISGVVEAILRLCKNRETPPQDE